MTGSPPLTWPAIVAALVFTLSTACGSGGDGNGSAAPGSTTSTMPTAATKAAPASEPDATTTSSAPATVEEAVLADYIAGWDAVLKAAEQRNPSAKAVLDYYAGAALLSTQAWIRALSDPLLSTGGLVSHEAKLVSLKGTEAVVHDCADDQTVQTDSFGVVVTPPLGRVGRDNRLRLEDGRWRTYEVVERPEICTP